MRAGFCICKCVMMCHEVISAGCSYGRKLVVRERASEISAGCTTCVIEDIVRIIHLIDTEHGLQASLIERTVVGNQRKALYKRLHLFPDIRKYRCIISIGMGKSVDPLAEPLEIVRLRMDKTIESICYLSSPHHSYAY